MPKNITALPRQTEAKGKITLLKVEDILDEAFSPLRAFQRIMDDSYATGEHRCDLQDAAIVLEALNTGAMQTAMERFETALEA